MENEIGKCKTQRVYKTISGNIVALFSYPVQWNSRVHADSRPRKRTFPHSKISRANRVQCGGGRGSGDEGGEVGGPKSQRLSETNIGRQTGP